jgi:isoquinoline 1-oxidoreductase beta subunit
MVELADAAGATARRDGRGKDALAGDGRRVAAEYRLPFLAHATMEPMNCTADVRGDHCAIHVPTQVPQSVRDEAARRLGLPPGSVHVQPTWAGGGFGRRVAQDFVVEAVLASRHARRPVQVLWTREDDFAHDHYRPCSLHRLEARLGADGLPVAWHHRIVTPSILAQDPRFHDPVDPVAVEGAKELPYRIADVQVDLVKAPAPCQLGFWRSVGHSFNAFAVECFVDEIAAAAGLDPVHVRRALLDLPAARAHRGVLDLAVAQAGAPQPGAGRGRGVAVHASFGSVVAMVADVHVDGERLVVERVTAAVDCGYAVHPDGVRAQIEGGVAFALAAAKHGRITFRDGAVVESNFHDHPLLRCSEMPRVDVHLVARDVPPDELGGVGEIAVPPLAPAVANAIAAATGRRVRELPLPFG